ncbi:hypothetical protein EJ07DRAFT_151641 [Lizonia empirigonia]|nr:hypothetical protein EJ07DRAFT_151641 [Lizonia empirigonia]
MPSASTSTDGLVSYVTTGMQQRESIRNNLPSLPEWIDGIIRNRNAPVSHSSDSDLLDDCAICFQSFTQNIERCRVRLFCGHRHFCLACMKDWAREGKTTCPYCRKQEWHPHMPLSMLLRSTIGLSTREASTTSQVLPNHSRATSPSDYLRWMTHALRSSVSMPEVVTEDYTPPRLISVHSASAAPESSDVTISQVPPLDTNEISEEDTIRMQAASESILRNSRASP